MPLIDQMNPDAGTLAAGGPVDLDLSKVAPGQQIVVRWRSRPIFVINRPAKALDALKSQGLQDRLADPQSQENQQPPYAKNWHRSAKPEYGVLVGICTHLGCIPMFYPQPNATRPAADWPGGYFCPCHGSKYDLAGRVFSGVPAPYNLPVPPYYFVNDTADPHRREPQGRHFRLCLDPPDLDGPPSCRGRLNSPLVEQRIQTFSGMNYISLGMNDHI